MLSYRHLSFSYLSQSSHHLHLLTHTKSSRYIAHFPFAAFFSHNTQPFPFFKSIPNFFFSLNYPFFCCSHLFFSCFLIYWIKTHHTVFKTRLPTQEADTLFPGSNQRHNIGQQYVMSYAYCIKHKFRKAS